MRKSLFLQESPFQEKRGKPQSFQSGPVSSTLEVPSCQLAEVWLLAHRDPVEKMMGGIADEEEAVIKNNGSFLSEAVGNELKIIIILFRED